MAIVSEVNRPSVHSHGFFQNIPTWREMQKCRNVCLVDTRGIFSVAADIKTLNRSASVEGFSDVDFLKVVQSFTFLTLT